MTSSPRNLRGTRFWCRKPWDTRFWCRKTLGHQVLVLEDLGHWILVPENLGHPVGAHLDSNSYPPIPRASQADVRALAH